MQIFQGFVARNALGTVVLMAIGYGLGFAITIALARFLGSNGYGIYAHAQAWLAISVVIALLGFPNLLVREVTRYRKQQNPTKLHALFAFTHCRLRLASACVTAGGIAIAYALYHDRPEMFTAIAVLLCCVPIRTYHTQYSSALRGMKAILPSQLAERLLTRCSMDYCSPGCGQWNNNRTCF